MLASIVKDLEIKVKDCKDWGAGRLVTVIANTMKNGQPDPGWTVMYKWISVSGLNAVDLAFPQISTPTSKGVPPGVYSVYATKQVGNSDGKNSTGNGIGLSEPESEMRDHGAVSTPTVKSEPHEPARFAAFAKFFKAYMGTAAVVTACLPIPVASLHLIPTYAAQEKFLSTYTSMFCFLMLGYLFYVRHWVGRLMFFTRADGRIRLRGFLAFLPLVLIAGSLSLVALYHHYLYAVTDRLHPARRAEQHQGHPGFGGLPGRFPTACSSRSAIWECSAPPSRPSS